MGMLYHWTRECDQGIAEIRYDRKALQGTLKKYIATVAKLPTVLSRGMWRTLEDPMLPVHKNRLECMITVRKILISVNCPHFSIVKPIANGHILGIEPES